MPRVNPPVGKTRKNVYVDDEQYEVFKQLSKTINYTFTDLVNEALKQFNTTIKMALETGDAQALFDLYNNQISEAKKQLEEYKEKM